MNWRQGETVDVLGKCAVLLGAGGVSVKRETLSTVQRFTSKDSTYDLVVWMVNERKKINEKEDSFFKIFSSKCVCEFYLSLHIDI
jgi:hypothetical protein